MQPCWRDSSHTGPSTGSLSKLLSERRSWQIPVDAYRRGNEYKVLLDLPGTDPGSIELTVEKDLLTVRAKRTWIQAEDDQVQIAERGQELQSLRHLVCR